LIHDAATDAQFNAVFEGDTDLSYGDVREVAAGDRPREQASSRSRACRSPSNARKPEPAPGTELSEATSVTPIFSPTTSLEGLTALLRSARRSIDVEQMNLDAEWKKPSSPLVDELLAAARRGVTVRVLLNDDGAFGHPGHAPADQSQSQSGQQTAGPVKNALTVEVLNRAARAERLPLEARIADLKAMGVTYIHNKGLLVDGDKTLISSINWVWNSVMNNRESAVVLEGEGIFAHYAQVFERDWSASAR
jgi:phosphatidylserine/phosphatidylglycerophosphate/cardiolipin synthase-like enzyme